MTGHQLDLLDTPVDVDRSKLPLDVRYRDWIAENPHVLGVLADTARQLRDQGARVSISRVFEEVRERVRTRGDEYQLNNSFRAFTARDLMDRYPDLDGLFRTRRSKADR